MSKQKLGLNTFTVAQFIIAKWKQSKCLINWQMN